MSLTAVDEPRSAEGSGGLSKQSILHTLSSLFLLHVWPLLVSKLKGWSHCGEISEPKDCEGRKLPQPEADSSAGLFQVSDFFNKSKE